MIWFSEETCRRRVCVMWTDVLERPVFSGCGVTSFLTVVIRLAGHDVFWAKCGYRESHWYAPENSASCVEGRNLRVSLKASGCDRQFVGQWIRTERYGGQLGSTGIAVKRREGGWGEYVT